jgi:type I restriction enzyme S subunit
MADENWKTLPLGECLTLQRGFDLSAAERKPGSVPVISSSGITGYHDTAPVKGPGVVTGRYGTIGQVFYVEQDFWPLNTTLWVKDFKGNNPKFVSFLLRTIDFRSCSDKSSVPGVNRNDLHCILVDLPPPGQQRAIADVLSAFDDKIELNRRMNQTLESMARAIFRSWFVDFDPVVAKAAGRQPFGMSPDVASLFPNRFVDSGMGSIPSGWVVQTVAAIAARVAIGPFGSRITRDNFVAEGVPVIRGNNLGDGFWDDDFVFLTPEKADELRSANARAGDLVFTHRGTLGQVGMIPPQPRHARYVVSQSQMLLSVDRERISPTLVYHFLRSPVGQEALLTYTCTTGVPAIAQPTTSLKRIEITVPPTTISALFDETVGPLIARPDANRRETETLAGLRDTLLPKLMSGELRVRDAEKLVGTHA